MVQNSGNFTWPIDVVVLLHQPREDVQRFPAVCWLWCRAPVSLSLLSTVWHCASTSDCVCAKQKYSVRLAGSILLTWWSESIQCEIAGSTVVAHWSGIYSVWIERSILRCCSSPIVRKRAKKRKTHQSASDGRQLAGAWTQDSRQNLSCRIIVPHGGTHP